MENEKKSEQGGSELTEEQKATIERRRKEVESGEATLIPLSEVKERMKKLFH